MTSAKSTWDTNAANLAAEIVKLNAYNTEFFDYLENTYSAKEKADTDSLTAKNAI